MSKGRNWNKKEAIGSLMTKILLQALDQSVVQIQVPKLSKERDGWQNCIQELK